MTRQDSVADAVSSGSVLLTIEGAHALRRERDDVAREHAALTQRLEVLNNKLEAIKLFLPPHLQEELAENGGASRKRIWAPIVFQILTENGQAMTTAEIAAKIKDIPFAPDPGSENSALYNGLAKMVRKGELHKHDGYFLIPGQPINKRPEEPKLGRLQLDILNALKSGPLKSADIIKAILDIDAPSATAMMRSTGRFYKTLAHMVRIGLVQRDGRLYGVAPQKNEPSDAGTSNGSDAGSGDERPRTLRLV